VPALRGVAFADLGATFVVFLLTALAAVLRAFAAGFFFALAFAFDFVADARFPDERAAFARAGFAFAIGAR
jgi:hypothetical protein